jgi:hypothetical protein
MADLLWNPFPRPNVISETKAESALDEQVQIGFPHGNFEGERLSALFRKKLISEEQDTNSKSQHHQNNGAQKKYSQQ